MLTDDDLAVLREHGIAIFRGKVILEAEPPISDAQLSEVEARLTGPIPEGLRQLWKTAFGGSLDYDLVVSLGAHRYETSFRELFYPGSDGYRDLFGWIDHELELATEAAAERGQPPPKALEVIPFGGFEYLERLYVSLYASEVGKVLLWAQGLPPAWKMRLNQDTVGVVADDVLGLFEQLELAQDPFADGADPNLRGIQMAEAYDGVAASHPAVAEKLRAAIQSAVFDWRAILASGPFAGSPNQLRAARLAFTHAAAHDDIDVARALLDLRYPTALTVTGDATAISLAMAKRAHRVAELLADSGLPLGPAPIVYAEGATAALVEKLIERDLTFDIEAVLSTAETGDLLAAQAILKRGKRSADFGDVRKATLARADQEDDLARRIDRGKLSSYLSAAEHRQRAAKLRELVDGLG